MRRIATAIIAMTFLQSVFASAEWPNEPAGSITSLDCPFSGQLCTGLTSVYKNLPFANDATAPLSPSGVLDYYLPAGATTGGGAFVHYFNQSNKPREVYVGTWWKTNPEFDGNINNGNKMIFIQGAESGGGGNFIMWGGPVEGPKAIMFATQQDQQFGAGNCHVPNWQSYGVCQSSTAWPNGTHGAFYNNVGSGLVGPGTGWHRIETYQKSSSTYTSRDGIIRMWLDGNLILDVRNANLLPNGFTDVQYNATWDGSSNYQCNVRDCRRARHHYYDHLRISLPSGASIPVQPIAITSPLQTSAQAGRPYFDTLTAENGKAPYGWTISAGSLPPGLTLNKATGILSGTPTTVGRSDFTVKVMDSSLPSKEATKSFTIIISGNSGIAADNDSDLKSSFFAGIHAGKVAFRYPNTGVKDFHLNVYNLAGKKVFENKAHLYGRRVETALKNGIYLAVLTQGDSKSMIRFHVIN